MTTRENNVDEALSDQLANEATSDDIMSSAIDQMRTALADYEAVCTNKPTSGQPMADALRSLGLPASDDNRASAIQAINHAMDCLAAACKIVEGAA